jgi:restriction endonuclease
MSDLDTGAQARQHLLEVVERYRAEKCEALLEQAQQQARQLVRESYAEARSRARRGIAQVRQQSRDRIAAAEAHHQTRIRQQRQAENSKLLAGLWQPLQEELQLRWQQPEARHEWVEAVVAKALASLRASAWQVEHPPQWPQPERDTLRRELQETELSFVPCSDVRAGLRICAGGACVDGSVQGLLRDRTRIESLLLARLNRQCETQHSGAQAS